MNFGPHISTLLESHQAGLQVTKTLRTKVQKRLRYGDGAKNKKNPTFSKLLNFGKHISTLLESRLAGLQVNKILWTKVQKRQRYGDGSEKQKTLTFSKLASDI